MTGHRFPDGEIVKITNKNRFTRFLPKGHSEMSDLEKWRNWFLSRGINACLVEVKGQGFAVYRNNLRQMKETTREGKKAGVRFVNAACPCVCHRRRAIKGV